MSLIVVLLLVIAALSVAIRILDSRRTAGVVMLGVVALALLGPAMSRLAHVASRGNAALAASPNQASVSAAEEVTVGDTAGTEAASAMDRNAAESPDAVAPDGAEGEAPAAREDTLTIQVEAEAGSVVIPPRPSWVESEDVRAGDVHTIAVSSGPHETERECRTFLDRELQRAVAGYVDWYLGNVYDDRFQASSFVQYELDEIKRRLVPADRIYHEVIKVSFGPMHQMHAQLHFDPAFRRELDGRRAELDRRWREWIVAGRLWGTGLSFAVLLALMSVFFGFFRLDTATRGFYTGRLQFLAAVVILTVLTAGALLARQILLM